jgi:hypothetical protein
MNYNTHVTDSYMLKFVEDKIKNWRDNNIEDVPYFIYIRQHLKEVWYGLMIADLMLPPSPKIDDFINKFGHKAFDDYHKSVEFSSKNKSMPMGVNKIGDFYPDA